MQCTQASILAATAARQPTHGDADQEGQDQVPKQLHEQIIHGTIPIADFRLPIRRRWRGASIGACLFRRDREFDTPVLGAVGGGVVGGDGTRLAIADCGQTIGADTGLGKIVVDGLCTPL
jgi:hypothetical protein